jgi:hypothetical protein
MAWKILGNIFFSPSPNLRATPHMQGPVAIVIDKAIRIYFSARGLDKKSYPAFLDVSIDNPLEILSVQELSILDPGSIGTFDSDGLMPACVLKIKEKMWMYYSGWNHCVSVPYHNTTGLAFGSLDGNKFKRTFEGPILDRTYNEGYMAVTPWVRKDSDTWEMWYVSGLGWINIENKMEPIYGIKYAKSNDGINWNRSGELVIPRRHNQEAISRPTVIKRGQNYHMWFSYRDSVDFRDGKGSYKIGYASSKDGVNWVREDKLSGFNPSTEEWDLKMQCYPYVLDLKDRLILFYNGNGFGQTGIGVAIWEDSLPVL